MCYGCLSVNIVCVIKKKIDKLTTSTTLKGKLSLVFSGSGGGSCIYRRPRVSIVLMRIKMDDLPRSTATRPTSSVIALLSFVICSAQLLRDMMPFLVETSQRRRGCRLYNRPHCSKAPLILQPQVWTIQAWVHILSEW
jgi:hypothetical protein